MNDIASREKNGWLYLIRHGSSLSAWVGARLTGRKLSCLLVRSIRSAGPWRERDWILGAAVRGGIGSMQIYPQIEASHQDQDQRSRAGEKERFNAAEQSGNRQGAGSG